MAISFERMYPPSHPAEGPAYWLLFRGSDLVVQEQDVGLTLLKINNGAGIPFEPGAVLFLGMLNGMACMAGEIDAECPLPPGLRAVNIRTLFDHLDETAYSAVGYASHVLRWQRDSRYCPVCGHAQGELAEQWVRQCPQCGFTAYPLVSPAILVLVHDGPRVLLVHKPGWGARFSIVAGFVEPAETLEQCVQREVREEVGVDITDITYISSQPWPFPHQLMIGFLALYASGEIHPDQREVDQAAWSTSC